MKGKIKPGEVEAPPGQRIESEKRNLRIVRERDKKMNESCALISLFTVPISSRIIRIISEVEGWSRGI